MNAYLSRIALAQFRSHSRTSLTLDARPVALWGANGAGKTNVLEAVSLLSPGRGLRRAAAEDMARRDIGVGWKISADLAGSEVELAWTPDGGRALRLDGKASGKIALARLARIVWLVPAQDRLWIEGAEGRRRFFDRIAMSFKPDHAAATLSYEKAMRERNRLLKDGISDDRWFGVLEAQMAEAATVIMANRRHALGRLAQAQDGADTAFPAADLSLIEVEEGDQTPAALASAFAGSRPRDLAAGRTLIGPHRSDISACYAAKSMPAGQCSTGEQKALLVSLVLANARALKADTGTPPIALLDEVAAHLDSDRRAALFDEICALGCQAWMTGTGPELFAELGDRAQGFTLSDKGGISELTAA
ncbi:MAG: DNA replication/repair protein RecF [Pseudomonadota bacterium]